MTAERSASVSIDYRADVAWLTDWQDGYALPSHFNAEISADWLDYAVTLELSVSESTRVSGVRVDRKVRCVGLALRARDGGEAVTAKRMRNVPLGECVRLATAAALRPVERSEDSLTIQLMGPPGATEVASRSPQRRVTLATLEEVRDIYLQAEHKPTDAVLRQHSERPGSYSTAARWVMKARQRGLIPPTSKENRR
jgi:hypothetical protein